MFFSGRLVSPPAPTACACRRGFRIYRQSRGGKKAVRAGAWAQALQRDNTFAAVLRTENHVFVPQCPVYTGICFTGLHSCYLCRDLFGQKQLAGVGDVPAGVVPYLTHPWVIANDKLKAVGWTPTHSNADAIREAVAALAPRDPRPALAAGAGAVVFATGTMVLARRRRRRDG